jgi:hypothetical protein
MPTYRGVKLEVVEDPARQGWIWTMRMQDPKTVRSGFSRSRLEAMFAAEYAIDRVLAHPTETSLPKLK